MKILKNNWVYMAVILCATTIIASLSCADIASAHSTKGRIKTTLNLAKPTVDDFAYFMESYVHNELYRHRIEQWERRFYVREFKRVDFSEDGRKAEVFFIRLDTKDNSFLGQSMVFQRDENRDWFFTDDTGAKVVVYTYLTKMRYYYIQYILPISSVAVALLITLFGVLVWRRNRVKNESIDNNPEGSTNQPAKEHAVDSKDEGLRR